MKPRTAGVAAAFLAALLLAPSMIHAAKTMRTVPLGDRYGRSALELRTEPRMAIIPETRVYYIRDESDYDLYRHGDLWYFVDKGNWYRAHSWRGPFVFVRTGLVPRAVLTVPAGYRRNWVPPRRAQGSGLAAKDGGTIQVGDRYRGSAATFFAKPNMAIIPETNVSYLRDESDYDLYQYGGSWYLMDGGNWYRARSWRGPFVYIARSTVPEAVLTIPAGYRKNWVALPPQAEAR